MIVPLKRVIRSFLFFSIVQTLFFSSPYKHTNPPPPTKSTTIPNHGPTHQKPQNLKIQKHKMNYLKHSCASSPFPAVVGEVAVAANNKHIKSLNIDSHSISKLNVIYKLKKKRSLITFIPHPFYFRFPPSFQI